MGNTLYACMGSGNCFKPWQVMKILGIPFDLKLVDVLQGEQKSTEYLRVNPLGVVPYLITDDGTGIGESNAMAWMLAEGSHLMPESLAERAEALQWMFFEQAKLEPFISPARFFTSILPDQREKRATEISAWQQNARVGLSHLDRHLSERSFIVCSGYSVADIVVFGYVHVLEEAGLRKSEFPNVSAWIDRVAATKDFHPLVRLGSEDTSAAA